VLFVLACAPEAPAPRAPGPPVPSTSVAAGPASTPPSDAESTPVLRLPSDTRPLAEALELRVDPGQDRFSGRATIDLALDRPRSVVWLHGRGLHVSRATLVPEGDAPIDATWQQRNDDGIAAIGLARQARAGKARLVIEYDAPFSDGLVGLYRTHEGGAAYAFTQFEPLDARRAFPCFDEPGFKIPFDVALIVPRDAQAIANSAERDRTPTPDGAVRVAFGVTPPLPSYLVAFAVGPLDVVRAPDVPPNAARTRPLPLRLVAARGRGPELAYAAKHAGEIVSALETYFGLAYPYEKLDVLAVPDLEGAMENAGAITFDEPLLLLDEKTAPQWQKNAFAYVFAHEASHQWFGDLVTMAWWNDLWLNESFATWMGYKAVDLWDPKLEASTWRLREAQDAMARDALASARQIRQPVAALDDVRNAFDDITYGKGGGVLAMFERWIGDDAFRRGVRAHLDAHRFGSATADDFLSALSGAAGRDVAGPFRTFLDQPGVPLVDTTVTCDGQGARLHARQSRYLPLGSSADPARTWQIPVCVSYGLKGGTRDACVLLAEQQADVPLEGCPDWVMPNAGGAGYYRFGLTREDWKKLSTVGLARLKPTERAAYAGSLHAAFDRATLPMGDVLDQVAPLVTDPKEEVAGAPASFLSQARDWLYAEPPLRTKIDAYERRLYAPVARRLGWTGARNEDADRGKLRRRVLWALAVDAREPAARAEAKRRAAAYLGKDDRVHPDALDGNVVDVALTVAGQDADAALFDSLLAHLAKSEDAVQRDNLLSALSGARRPELAARARELVLSGTLRLTETLRPISVQLEDPELREQAWAWTKEHFDQLVKKLEPQTFGTIQLLQELGVFCDDARAEELRAFLSPRLAAIEGGAREGASTIEGVTLCAAKRKAQEPGARAYFSR
jgi:alanyl aminopeptidase